MLAEEVKDFCSEGSTVRIFSHGENVFGVVKKLSDSSIIIMRSDNTRKMITYDKIESIDEVASVLVTKSPEIVKFASAPALETPLIYLPSINPAKVFHRDQIKEELKENYKVQKVWNIVDNMFESAKKNQSLNEKKTRLNSELSGLLSTYPINPIYLFAGDVYSAYEDWANAAFFYVKAQAYSEALNCAKKISNDYNPLMYVLSAMADDEKNPTDDYLRTFFYYSATFRRHKIVAEVLEKILNKFTDYQIKIACQGGYKILKESNNEKRLNWWEFKYNLESIRQLIEVLREIGKDEPPVKVPEIKFSVSATNQKKSKLSGKITFYKQNERYGFINSNIYFQLPQVEDYNLRFALENNGLWKKDLAVEYLIGKSYPKNAADHITLVEDEEIPSRKVEIYKGYLSNYEAFKERGYVIDHQGQTYQFAIDAILDPCLKWYLKDSVNIRTFDVEFTLKFYNGNLVVRNLILSETDSKLLRKEYGLSQDFDKPNLIPQLREPPAYFSLPPTSSYVSTTTKSITSPVIVPVVTEPALPKSVPLPAPKISVSSYNGRLDYDSGCNFMYAKNDNAAISCFEKSLKDVQYFEKSLKNLISIYMRMDGKAEQGLEILKKYETRLDSTTFNNLKIQLLDKAKKYDELANELKNILSKTNQINKRLHYILQLAVVYRFIGEYENSIKYYKLWIKESNTSRYAIPQKNVIEWSAKQGIAVCLYLMGQKDEAKKIAQEILGNNPNNIAANAIIADNYTHEDELNIPIYREVEIVPYAQFIIDQINTKTMIKRGTQFSQHINEEGIYIGTPHNANDDMTKFEKETIKKSPAQSKKEEWALLAKVVLQVMSQYSENIALCEANKITQSLAIKYAGRSMVSAGDYEIQTAECNIDSARFFYSEAIYMLPERQADITNSFLRFIATFFLTREEVNKLKPVDEPLYLGYLDNCECKEPEKLIASTFLFHEKVLVKVNEFILAMATNDYWRKKLAEVISFDKSIEITDQTVWDCWLDSKNSFLQKLENLRKILNEYEINLSSMLGFDAYRTKINTILESKMLYTTDENNIKKFLELLEKIISVAMKDTFEQKEEIYKNIIDKTKSLAETIERKPTKLSYEVLREIFIKLQHQAEEDLKKLYEDTQPKLKIDVQEIATDNDRNGVRFNLFISNEENCQTAEITEIVIKNTKNGQSISPKTESIKTIRGGDHEACLYEIILSEKEKENGNLEIAINLEYKYKTSIDERAQKQISDSINIPLLLEEYIPIKNKYNQLKEGNGVPLDSELFYGREDDIKKIVDMLQFENGNLMKKRGIIMYGQKRAGKTSIMDRLKERIIKKYGNSAYLIVEIGSAGEIIGNKFLGFLSILLSNLENFIEEQQPNLFENLRIAGIQAGVKIFPYDEIESADTINKGVRIFQRAFKKIIQKLQEQGGSNRYIPMFLIDEFTYFYEWIKKGKISSDFMKFWKGFLQDYPVCSIIIGQDSMPKFIAEYQNEFACMSKFPVTFLKKQYIDKLASEPILLPDGSSRYKGTAGKEALAYIYSLTAGSAYLTVIFCSNFVEYLNETKTTYITKTVIDNFIKEKLLDNLTLEMFNPQIDDPSKFSYEKDSTIADNKEVLTYIANHADSARELEEDKIDCIEYLSDKSSERRSKILEQLKDRGVLSKRSNKYKIEIELLQMWLKRESGRVI